MAAYASSVERPPGSWEWPEDLLPELSTPTSAAHSEPGPQSHTTSKPEPSSSSPQAEQPKPQKQKNKQRHYRPRTCRICLETVLPTFRPASENLPEVLQGSPHVVYESEGGRLISPCKCKGSSRYVHETCLQEWRHADPSYGKRNYWNCPTCGFRYRLGRLSWGYWLSSPATQITLTITIFLLAVFASGFVADPIINLYLDPLGTVTSMPSTSSSTYTFGKSPFEDVYDEFDEIPGWAEHFLKGFASLGLVGFIKVFFTMGTWNWFNMRQLMGGNARTGTTGRDRVANISWIVVLVGVVTFLYTVWKMVRAWSRRVLEKASEGVVDIQHEGGDMDEDDDDDNDDAR